MSKNLPYYHEKNKGKWLALVFILHILGTVELMSQSLWGGSLSLEQNLMLPKPANGSRAFEDLSLQPAGKLETLFNVYSEWFSLEGRGSLIWHADDIQVDLGKLEAVVFAASWLQLRLGRTIYDPGVGEVSSPTSHLLRNDLTALFEGNPTFVPADLMQGTAFFGNGYFTATISPGALKFVLPETMSEWFPSGDLPQSVNFPFQSYPSIRRSIQYLDENDDGEPDAENFPQALDAVSYCGELGYQGISIDLSAVLYYGQDLNPLLSARILRDGTYFDIHLRPVYSKIFSAGINLAGSVAGFRFWFEGAFQPKRMFSTSRVGATNLADLYTKTATSRTLEITGGLSWEPGLLGILTMAEYHRILPLTEEELIPPLLSHSLMLSLGMSLFDYRFTPSMNTLVSLTDYSVIFMPQMNFSLSDELSMELRFPFCLGRDSTELGQFRNNLKLTLEITFQY